MSSSTFIEDYVPVVKYNGLNTEENVVVTGTTCTLPSGTTIGGAAVVALATITSVSANALTVGRAGTTNPAFNVDASAATSATGLNVAAAAAAGGLAVSVLSSDTNESLTLDAKGSGTVTLNGTATGAVVLPAAITIATGATITGTGTGANGIVLKNLKNAAAASLSGTDLTVEIDIGGTPYYFLVSPTAS